jgi:hypothetical protein
MLRNIAVRDDARACKFRMCANGFANARANGAHIHRDCGLGQKLPVGWRAAGGIL